MDLLSSKIRKHGARLRVIAVGNQATVAQVALSLGRFFRKDMPLIGLAP
jgi:hypothetical protein